MLANVAPPRPTTPGWGSPKLQDEIQTPRHGLQGSGLAAQPTSPKTLNRFHAPQRLTQCSSLCPESAFARAVPFPWSVLPLHFPVLTTYSSFETQLKRHIFPAPSLEVTTHPPELPQHNQLPSLGRAILFPCTIASCAHVHPLPSYQLLEGRMPSRCIFVTSSGLAQVLTYEQNEWMGEWMDE